MTRSQKLWAQPFRTVRRLLRDWSRKNFSVCMAFRVRSVVRTGLNETNPPRIRPRSSTTRPRIHYTHTNALPNTPRPASSESKQRRSICINVGETKISPSLPAAQGAQHPSHPPTEESTYLVWFYETDSAKFFSPPLLKVYKKTNSPSKTMHWFSKLE